MKDEITIKKVELRVLLFWAVAALVDSNGGSGVRTLLKTLEKYSKDVGFNSDRWPALSPRRGIIDGEQAKKVQEILKRHYPRAKRWLELRK